MGNAPSDCAQHLVRNGLGQTGDVVHADDGLAGAAPQGDLIADPRARNIRQVHHRKVHANGAYHRGATAADYDFAPMLKAATIAVGVADREHTDRAFTRRYEGMAIAYTGPCEHPLKLHQPGLEGHHGPQADFFTHGMYRRKSTEGKPRTRSTE